MVRALSEVFIVRMLLIKCQPLRPVTAYTRQWLCAGVNRIQEETRISNDSEEKRSPKDNESFANPAAMGQSRVSEECWEKAPVQNCSTVLPEQTECPKYSENSCCWGKDKRTKLIHTIFLEVFTLGTLPKEERKNLNSWMWRNSKMAVFGPGTQNTANKCIVIKLEIPW